MRVQIRAHNGYSKNHCTHLDENNTPKQIIMATLKQRSNKWYAVWFVNGRRIVKATGIPIKGKKEQTLALNTANAMEAAAKGNVQLSRALDSVRSAADAMGMGETIPIIEDYFKEYKPSGGINNNANYNRAVSTFLSSLGVKKVYRLDRLTPSMCRDFCIERLKHVSLGTVRHNVALLKAAINGAVRDGIIDRNPFCSFSISSLAPPSKARAVKRYPFTLNEMKIILNDLPERWRNLSLFSLLTGGQRLGDICTLEWKHVDLEKNIITFNTHKTGKEIIVPIHPKINEILQSKQNGDAQYVFPDEASSYFSQKGCMSTEFTTLLKSHGVITPEDIVTTPGGRKMSRKSFHSIRHTVVTMMRSSNMFTADLTRELVGHDSEEIERQYFTATLEAKGLGLAYLFDTITKSGKA